jgi:hypothetical protein
VSSRPRDVRSNVGGPSEEAIKIKAGVGTTMSGRPDRCVGATCAVVGGGCYESPHAWVVLC